MPTKLVLLFRSTTLVWRNTSTPKKWQCNGECDKDRPLKPVFQMRKFQYVWPLLLTISPKALVGWCCKYYGSLGCDMRKERGRGRGSHKWKKLSKNSKDDGPSRDTSFTAMSFRLVSGGLPPPGETCEWVTPTKWEASNAMCPRYVGRHDYSKYLQMFSRW